MSISVKNTKQEIYDAYLELLKKEENKRIASAGPAEKQAEQKDITILESAKETYESYAGILAPEFLQKYDNFNKALAIKKEELTALYDIDSKLQNLGSVINSCLMLKDKLHDDLEEYKLELEREKKAATHKYNDEAIEERIRRNREKEEYTYKLIREHKADADAWDDEKAKREAEIAAIEAEATAKLKEINAKVDSINEMELKVADIPNLIDTAKADGIAIGEANAGKEYGYKKAMYEKEYEYKLSNLTNELNRATAEADKANAKADELQAKLDKAYSDLRDLAATTVQSTGGIKILNNNPAEIARK